MALSLRTDLMVIDLFDTKAAFADLFRLQVFRLDTELEIELATRLERFFSVISVSFDILKKLI